MRSGEASTYGAYYRAGVYFLSRTYPAAGRAYLRAYYALDGGLHVVTMFSVAVSVFYMGEEPVLRCTAPTKALEGAQPTKDKPLVAAAWLVLR